MRATARAFLVDTSATQAVPVSRDSSTARRTLSGSIFMAGSEIMARTQSMKPSPGRMRPRMAESS